MTAEFPRAIAGYFAADATKDAESVAKCFTDAAVVRDEGKIHRGRDAIRAWKAHSSSTYSYTSQPFAIATEGERTVVTSRLEGDFPGSPVDLRYFFTLEGDRIANLEIIP